MIYIFNGCKSVCSLPGQACGAIGQCCGSINCEPIKDCCQQASTACTQFNEQPLCSFVVIAVVISLVELYDSYLVMTSTDTPDVISEVISQGSLGLAISTWALGQMGFSVLNLVFAPWFQHQVWKQIMKDAQEPGLVVVEGSKQKLDKKVVQGAFKTVFLTDMSVLFYFFAMLASCVWSWQGAEWNCAGEAATNAYNAHWWGLCMFWVAFLYSSFWYCCSCCASSVELSQPITSYGAQP